MVERGPCGEKLGHYTEVVEEKLGPEFGREAYIRWLISEKDGAKTYAMRIFRIGVGGVINRHKHPWEHEIFVLKGTLRLGIGSRKYVVREGYFIYIPPNVEHDYENIGDEEALFICTIPNKPTDVEREVKC
jgi:quercetin dioxygenase-like cupin family protein